MAETLTDGQLAGLMAELAELEDPRAREVNGKHGDDHGVNLSKLRAIAKRLKTQQDLSRQLWQTGDTTARLLALLVCRPKAFGRDELDGMLREARPQAARRRSRQPGSTRWCAGSRISRP